MQIGDHVRIVKDIPPILGRGETGQVRERWLRPTETRSACWIVDFPGELIPVRSHFVYEDEMEVLELRIADVHT